MALHEAAGRGDLDAVRAALSSPDGVAKPNAPDADGRSAIFYAQLRGHTEIIELLVSKGWTPMPEGCTFRGPGGRSCFWTWNQAVAAPKVAPRGIPMAAPVPDVMDVDTCVDLNVGKSAERQKELIARAKQAKRQGLHERRAARRAAHASTEAVLGREHPLYARKTQGGAERGGRSRSAKPFLNTRDFADVYQLPRDMIAAASEYAAAASADGDVPQEAGAAMHPQSTVRGPHRKGGIARFVVDCKPRWSEDGWVVVEPASGEEMEAALCAHFLEAADEAADSGEVGELAALTGLSREGAGELLEAAGGDASLAATLHFESGPPAVNAVPRVAADGVAVSGVVGGEEWPPLPASRSAGMEDEWVVLFPGDRLSNLTEGSSDGGAEEGDCDDFDVRSMSNASVLIDDAFEALSEADIDIDGAVGPPRGAAEEDAEGGVGSCGRGGAAWSSAAATKAAVSLAAGAAHEGHRAAFTPLMRRSSPTTSPNQPNQPTIHPTTLASLGATRFDDEDSASCLSDFAGLKDASHRMHGGRGNSAKAATKRETSIMRRQTQRAAACAA